MVITVTLFTFTQSNEQTVTQNSKIMTFNANTTNTEILEVNALYFITVSTDCNDRPCAKLSRRTPKGKYRKEETVGNYFFRSEEARYSWVIKQCNKILEADRQVIERKAKAKAAQQEAVKSGLVKVGDIFTASWGYDQTNVDFYEVISISGTAVKLRELKQVSEQTGLDYGQTMPVPGSYRNDEVLSHRVNFKYSEPTIKVSDSSWARPWNGRSMYHSSGH